MTDPRPLPTLTVVPDVTPTDDDFDLDAEIRRATMARRVQTVVPIWEASVPRRHQAASWDAMVAHHPEQTIEVIRAWARQGPTENLVLSGPPGTGKTWLACAIGSRLASMGRSAQFVTASQVVAAARPGGDADLLARASRVQVLVLDDLLASGEGTAWASGVVADLIAERHAECRATIVTTNASMGSIGRALGDRVVDRLRDALQVTLTGASMRGQA